MPPPAPSAPPPCWFESLRDARTPAHRRAWLVTAAMCAALLLAQAVLAALMHPAPLPFGLVAGLAGTLWLAAALALVRFLAPGAPWTGFAHYAARILLLAFAVLSLWSSLANAQGVYEELSPYNLGPLLCCCALFPATRLLREAAQIRPDRAPVLLRIARRLRYLQIALFAVAVAVVVTGIFVEMRKDYPVDPTVILAILWSAAIVSALVALSNALTASSSSASSTLPARPLDDPPPEPPPAAPSSPRFTPDDW